MPTPVNRAKIQLVRGSYSNISASIADLVDGELCYAKDQNRLYMVEGSTLTQIEADPEDIEGLIASIVVGGTGITSTHDDASDTVTLDLADTAVTTGEYGSSTQIPVITIDQQGRITAASEVTFDAQTLALSVHNQTGADLSKGDAVYVSGTHTSGKPTVALADNNGTNTYPAIGLVGADITNGTDGEVIISGQLTNIDTSTYSAGAALYIDSTPGAVTTTRPTASTEKVQKVGLVTKSHASSGSILIIGAGRTNDINNELVALTGVALNDSDLGTFTGSTITDNSSIKTALQELETKTETAIVDADISATAEIAVSKLANGTARQLLQTSADGNNVEFTSNVDVPGTLDVTGDATFDQAVTITGDLTVNGTTTTIDTTTLTVEDKNIELGTVTTPTDVTANGGGITLKGSTDHTIIWTDSTDSWDFSEHVNIASGKEFQIAGTKVLDATSLGSAVVTSSLTSVGTIATGTWNGTAIDVAYGGTGQTSYTNGQLLIGNTTGNTLTKATLTAGSGISITNGAGSIEIAATAGSSGTVTSVDITGGTGLSSSGGPITSSGSITVSLDNTAVTAGSYTAADITVDAQGRITAAASGTIGNSEIADSAVTSNKIQDGTIVNADVNASAAIAGSKIDPDFGSQTVETTGKYVAGSGSAAAPSFTFGTDTNTGLYRSAADEIKISTNGTERFLLDSGGVLYVPGVYSSTTSGSANVRVTSVGRLARATSSQKYKTNIETLEDSYADAILNCRPVWYQSTCEGDNPNHGHWGFIAEEVAEIDPRLVFYKDTEISYDESGSVVSTPCNLEPESVQYDRFVPHLLNLIKRQQQAIETLQTKVAALESA